MTRRDLIVHSLAHYWRVNVAVALGVGVAVSALAGALVVGSSVRASLRDLALARLGRADHVVTAGNLFTEQLAERVASHPAFRSTWEGPVPMLVLEGVVTHERTNARAGGVQIYGVDDRFWSFNGVAGVNGPANREAFVGAALARELGAAAGDALLLRVHKPSAIPAGVIQGRRDEPGRAVRLSLSRVLERDQLGEFSPRPQQGVTRTIFVPLDRLQRDLELPHRVNTMLVAARSPAASNLTEQIEQQADLGDLGVRMRTLKEPALAIESDAGLLTDAVERGAADAARAIGIEPVPVLTYIATAIRANGRETPYSLVSALPESVIASQATPSEPPATSGAPPIWLTQWSADDLGARPGDRVTLDYFVWSDDEGLTSASKEFSVAGVLPMRGLAVDADLTPDYPGVSTSANITDWDPPFPVDLKRIRPQDEEFWDNFRTAPKAFVRIEDGQAIWQSRYGKVSSLRIPAGGRATTDLDAAYRDALTKHLPAKVAQFRSLPIRDNALTAASGTTDFGEYFTYFSFFLVVSSLLLTLLFFRLGIEQRAREIGLLTALGYSARAIRSLLMSEGLVLAAIGAAVGVAGALAYSWLIMFALRTWWVDAVGTTDLTVHPSASPLVIGSLAGIAGAIAFIAWSLRVVHRASARQLMSGAWVEPDQGAAATPRPMRIWATACVTGALALVAAATAQAIPAAAGFFGSGTLLLIAGLCALAGWLRGSARRTFIHSRWPVGLLGLRNARYRPARSVLSVTLVAAATFLIVSVGAFRRGVDDVGDAKSGSGGYAVIAETVSPLMHDPSTAAGRGALSLGPELEDITVARFRLRPGDDASCLNLYRPQNPRLLGATDAFIQANRFTFSASIAESADEQANPWLLLRRRFDDGAVPVIGDATSLTYVFHLGVGDDFVMQGPAGQPLTLRIVGALRDSVLQSELIMGDAEFTRLFPRFDGYRVFLVGASPEKAAGLETALEDQLQDFGMDAQSTAGRLASYHRVENTYLNTFQALGALGLVLGTLGLGTVLLRNVLERRRELALLQATGYRRSHLVRLVLAESVFLLVCGLVLGAACAAIAIAPAYLDRGQAFPVAPTLGMLAAVFAAGLLSTVVATRFVATMPLLDALKNE